MRGKKIDTEYVAAFIQSCTNWGLSTPDEIVAQAQKEINEIDEKVLEVERLKKERSGLIDVLATLAPTVPDNSEEVKILNFYKVKNFALALTMCDAVLMGITKIDILKKSYDGTDMSFIMKELLELSVLKRNGKDIEKGKSFDEFVTYAKKRYTK